MSGVYENPASPNHVGTPMRGDGFALKRRRVPDARLHSKSAARPIFLSMMGRYRWRLLLAARHVPQIVAGMSGERLHTVPEAYDENAPHARRVPLHRDASDDSLERQALNGADDLHITRSRATPTDDAGLPPQQTISARAHPAPPFRIAN
ncbi:MULTISPECIES: hypothetical protein [Burkholderia]|uniref:Uncharacterized protein n=1 Tax=Burkholderia savannae TaxID=1637837 RepID=A0ABR5TFK5_9BURK|nr:MULTISPECIES: hypothetical protein [Burkholderia]AOJ80465.1 hypothetical protein WS86_07405 [Burkholderia savannae]AOK46685.1 hypothetical protein WT60_07340 [Burkholderia sp. MSMB617WGS]KGR94760.1 hypothetical protein X946_5305 [Burkholderia sp. ABCPW 111]KVK83451.1 hypothetical protein WS91_06670 [Burkholderia sp. MSMB1498]KWZ42674.1 hypothetical protein WS72_07190 [Burkholderia savannae]